MTKSGAGFLVAMTLACVALDRVAFSAPPATPAPGLTTTATLPAIPEPVARWVEPKGGTVNYPPGSCVRVIISAATGSITVDGKGHTAGPSYTDKPVVLAEGDAVGILRPAHAIEIKGNGTAALVEVPLECECKAPKPIELPKTVAEQAEAMQKYLLEAMGTDSSTWVRPLRRAPAPKYTWGKGSMSAELTTYSPNFEPCPVANIGSDGQPHNYNPVVYLGRLSGTAPVAEHAHADSWEVLFALEADGTMMLDGVPRHVGPKDIVKVPPKAKHSWQPAPGSRLVAVQAYAPPGPEKRFKDLAAQP